MHVILTDGCENGLVAFYVQRADAVKFAWKYRMDIVQQRQVI